MLSIIHEKWKLYQADYQYTLHSVAGTADLVVCSPPYADARTYGNNVSWTDKDYAALGDSVFEALKPGGTAIINVDSPVREWRKGFGTERGFHAWKLMIDWAERIGFRVPDRLAYGRMGVTGAYTGRFRNDWEPLLWFEKPGGVAFFNKHLIAGDAVYGNPGYNASRKKDGTKNSRHSTGWAQENKKIHRGTYWNYGVVGNRQSGALDIEVENHPARYPYKLAYDIVQCFCPPGGLIVDPFVGAGTSAAGDLAHGCQFVGGDMYENAEGEPWISVTNRILENRNSPAYLELFT